MNSDSELKIVLKDRANVFNLSQLEKSEEPNSNPKSIRKASPCLGYKRLSAYSKEKSQIPTVKEAKYRDKQIKYYHNRTFYKRKTQLQDIFKENMRLYQQLNKQKSYYQMNFQNQKVQKKHKKVHSISCTDNYTTKYVDIEKASVDDNFEGRGGPLERRFSFSVGRSCKNRHQKDGQNEENSKGMVRPESDFAINIKKRYEKNKTEMLPRKNKQRIEKSSELSSFQEAEMQGLQQTQKIKDLLKNDKMFTVSKNPGYMRMKRRPSSGIRC